ncbi:hypothetical protein J6590_051817 [Homalodisca vitripennis]|nr:hypothetical protein J6590_051817 [Homalodisca vitripennis]
MRRHPVCGLRASSIKLIPDQYKAWLGAGSGTMAGDRLEPKPELSVFLTGADMKQAAHRPLLRNCYNNYHFSPSHFRPETPNITDIDTAIGSPI